MRTAIQGGDIVAHRAGGHRLLRGGVLVFEDDRIVFVGRRYEGPVDARIDARDKLVMPGLINVHCHPTTEAGGRHWQRWTADELSPQSFPPLDADLSS